MTKARARERAKANALKKKKKKRLEAAVQPDSPDNNVTSGHIDKKANPMKPTTGPGGPTRITKGSARSR
jgi:hypothetical protein